MSISTYYEIWYTLFLNICDLKDSGEFALISSKRKFDSFYGDRLSRLDDEKEEG